MNPADAAELLTIAAAFDRRKIGKADAIAWADALDGLDVKDCAEAIRAHFRESTDYLMPVHVRQGVRRLRADRIRENFAEPEYERDDVLGGLEAIRQARKAIADGHSPDPAPAAELTARPVAELIATTAARMEAAQAFADALAAKKYRNDETTEAAS